MIFRNVWRGLCMIISISIGMILFISCSQQVPEVEKSGNSDLDASHVPVLLSLSNFQFDIATRGLHAFESMDSYGDDKAKAKIEWGNASFYVLSYLVNNEVYSGGSDMRKLSTDYVPSSDGDVVQLQYCLMSNAVDGDVVEDESVVGESIVGVPFHLDYTSSDTPSFTAKDGSKNFYYNGEPKNYKYDFFMYFADDAPLSNFIRQKNQVSCKVQIDGTQDLMQAKAGITDEQVASVILPNNDFFGIDYMQYVYCAQSGRRGLVPKFIAKHLMTQLKFQLLASDERASDVTVTDIIVKNINTTGTFVVANENEDALGVKFNSNPMDLHLPERDPVTFKMTDTSSDHLTDQVVQLGGDKETFTYPYGFLLPPSNTYEIQMVCKKRNEDTGNEFTFNSVYKIKLPEGKMFEAGSIYTIKISVYGYQKIVVTLDLPEWKDSGIVIDVSNEQDPYPVYTTGD